MSSYAAEHGSDPEVPVFTTTSARSQTLEIAELAGLVDVDVLELVADDPHIGHR